MKEDLYDDLFDEKEEKTDFQAPFLNMSSTGPGLLQVY